MTVIKFYKQNNNFVKLKATGHTGYAEQGKDILSEYALIKWPR